MSQETKTATSPQVIDPSLGNIEATRNGTRLIPLVDWPKFHPWPPLGGLRHMAFHGKTTGFSKVLKKVGRRVLIDEKKFFEFIEEQNCSQPSNNKRKAGKAK